MGWCADAIYAGVAYQYVDTDQDQDAAAYFRAAANQMIALGAAVDGALLHGSLDTSSAVRTLATYAGETDIAAVWSVAHTQALQQQITWPDISELPQNQRGPIASAQAFLAVCAERGYGIQFDP